MPSPHKFDPTARRSLLTCPRCFKLMRIIVAEADGGRERITLGCEDCGIEAMQDNRSEPKAPASDR